MMRALRRWLRSLETRIRLAWSRLSPDISTDVVVTWKVDVAPHDPPIRRGNVVWLEGRRMEVWGVDGAKAYVRDPSPFGRCEPVSVRRLVVQRDEYRASAPWDRC
jgi:hypothetical protein